MDVTIDTVSAELQREATSSPEPPRELRPPRERSETEWPELAFGSRRERLRARLTTY